MDLLLDFLEKIYKFPNNIQRELHASQVHALMLIFHYLYYVLIFWNLLNLSSLTMKNQ